MGSPISGIFLHSFLFFAIIRALLHEPSLLLLERPSNTAWALLSSRFQEFSAIISAAFSIAFSPLSLREYVMSYIAASLAATLNANSAALFIVADTLIGLIFPSA